MSTSISTPEALRKVVAGLTDALNNSSTDKLAQFLTEVAEADLAARSSAGFHTQLWTSETISATGQGKVSVDTAIADPEFRTWLARQSLKPVPSERDAALDHLREFYEQLKGRLSNYEARTPRLKIFRALAALFPHHFTTVADAGRMASLHAQMFGRRKADEVSRHANVLARLEEVLGPIDRGDMLQVAKRMRLPWLIIERIDEKLSPPNANDALTPLPAARRRKGLTAIGGGFPSVLRALDFVGEGATSEELLGFLKQENPTRKDDTHKVAMNILRSEFGLLDRSGELLVLSESGKAVLDSGEPDPIAPWLLTRVLGVDYLLATIRDAGAVPKRELLEGLQELNPGWTTDYAPGAMLSWLRTFGVTQPLPDGRIELTERGKRWAKLIHWEPDALDVSDLAEEEASPYEREVEAVVPSAPLVPALNDILAALPSQYVFSKEQVATLHAGLWAHSRRHFAVLTGLSGSGKTSLAVEYARALIRLTGGESSIGRRLLTVPVVPGWTDPTHLLGYINPLGKREYVRTRFVELLLSCAQHPSSVHVAILDEMNLSHPEQYLAPLLSGMERNDEPLVIHHAGDVVDGVPPALKNYPQNLVLIGTVNMDETTHGLSDKVLDRAVTLEFWDIELERYPSWNTRELGPETVELVRSVLSGLLAALAPARLHFGWRVVDEVLDFLARSANDGVLGDREALDWVVYSKVLPKVRGHDDQSIRQAFAASNEVLARHQLPRSRAKLAALTEDLQTQGSARFWR